MKKHAKKLIAILTLLLIPLIFLSSCTSTKESDALRGLTEKMINAMKCGDATTAFDLVAVNLTQEEFDEFYNKTESTFLQITQYELYTQAVSTDEQNGKTYETVQYILLSNEKNLIISASVEKGTDVMLSGFQVGEAEENVAAYIQNTGTVSTLGENGTLQWVLLGVSLLEIAFIVWMAIDCILHKIESKGLWLVFILLGIVSLSFTYGGESLGFGFDISFIFKYTALITHPQNLSTLCIMLPIGAVAYLILRKRLVRKAAEAAAKQAEKPVYHSYIPDDEKDDVTPSAPQTETDKDQPAKE